MRIGIIGISALASMASAQAHAQDGSAAASRPAAQDTAATEEPTTADIVVTGSLIARPDYVSASPVVTVGAEALKSAGTVNIEQGLNQLPQFTPASGAGGGGGTAALSAGRATLNLRGLGDRRTLVLLDGHRLPTSTAFNVADVNIIPTAILESVETVTGGGSAVYGSDAIGGVVQFRTKRRFDGIQLDGQIGNSFRGDYMTSDLAVSGGFNGFGDRLSVVFSGSYTHRDELTARQRSFYNLGFLSGFTGPGLYLPGSNAPSQATVDAYFATQGVAPGGVRNSTSLGFNNNGSLFGQTSLVNYQGPLAPDYSNFGGTFRQVSVLDQSVMRPLDRESAFVRANFEVSPALEIYAQGLYSHTSAYSSIGLNITQFIPALVSVNNPFIPSSLRPLLASRSNPNAPFQINQRFLGLGRRAYDTSFDTTQFVLGLRGETGVGDWKYDVYYARDRTSVDNFIDNAVLGSKMNQLLQAADGGASLCAGGYNPFGITNSSSISDACRAFVSRRIALPEDIGQDTVEAKLSGRLFALPAGDVQLSVLADYRRNTYDFDPGADLVKGDVFGFNQTAATHGRTSVKEVAAELFVPILSDTPFFQKLNLTVGGRYSDYNITGGIWSYKGELEWKPADMLMFRAGYQMSNRAPNVGELFSSATGTQIQIGNPPAGGDPCDVRNPAFAGANAAQLRALCVATGVPAAIASSYNAATVAVPATNTGNLGLKEEEAVTKTLGLVLSPRIGSAWARQLSLSVDFYDIKIKNVISTVAGNVALNRCYNIGGFNPTYSASDQFCQLISRSALNGDVTNVALPYLNLGGLKTRGLDIQLDWTIGLDEMGIGNDTSLAFKSVVSYLDSYQRKDLPGTAYFEYAGTIDYTNTLPLPKWRWLNTATLSMGKVDLGIRWKHMNAMRDVTVVLNPASTIAGVRAYDTFDLTGNLRVTDRFELRAGITNLTDKQPYVIGGTPSQTLPDIYDIVGRSFFIGVKAKI
ncbi:MAG: hypothetical protein BGP16_14490 [Sphingobium sp. 66-54]|mgnify:CR=1 FL=1|nr:MAG: hypothetical protein BGP16_14490 [Sphingobium sp. 66-54]